MKSKELEKLNNKLCKVIDAVELSIRGNLLKDLKDVAFKLYQESEKAELRENGFKVEGE